MVVGIGGHLLLAVGCGHKGELSSGCPWDVLALTVILTKRVALTEHLLCARSHAKAFGRVDSLARHHSETGILFSSSYRGRN